MLQRYLDRRFYPDYVDKWDEHIFRRIILRYLTGKEVILDLGAGSGNPLMNFKDRVAKVCGIDPDPRVLTNPFLHEARVCPGEMIDYPNCSFDLVFANSVLEHLNDPVSVFREVNRVLKPGGLFLAKTPNKFHYVTIAGRLTPLWFHKMLNSLRGVAPENVFETFYRANDEKTLRKLTVQTGFSVVSLDLIEGRPEYLRIFWPLYLAGILYERIVNKLHKLAQFRAVIIIILKKEGG